VTILFEKLFKSGGKIEFKMSTLWEMFRN